MAIGIVKIIIIILVAKVFFVFLFFFRGDFIVDGWKRLRFGGHC